MNRRCHLVDKNPLLGADQTDVDDTADDEWAKATAQDDQTHKKDFLIRQCHNFDFRPS